MTRALAVGDRSSIEGTRPELFDRKNAASLLVATGATTIGVLMLVVGVEVVPLLLAPVVVAMFVTLPLLPLP